MTTPTIGRWLLLASLALVSICCNNHVQGFSLRRQKHRLPTTRYPYKYVSSYGVDGPLRDTGATTSSICSPSPKLAKREQFVGTPRDKAFVSGWKYLWLRSAATTLTTADQQRRKSSPSWKKRMRRIGVALAVICGTTLLVGGVQPAWASTAAEASTKAPLPAVHLAPMLTRLQEVRLMGRLWYAALLGAAVGKERSTANHHPAGVRTLALVSLGSAAFTLCSMYGFGTMGKFDTSRMASAVASGAGVITTSSTRNQSVVHGLTTAAAVWISAAVGVTCGTGLYILASSLAIATLGFLRIGGNVKHKRAPHRRSDEAIVKTMLESDPGLLQKLVDWEKVNMPDIMKNPEESSNPQRMEDKDDECLISQRYFPHGQEGEKSCSKEDAEEEDNNNSSQDDDYFYDDDDDEVIVMTTGRGYRNETEDMSPQTRHSRPRHYDDDAAP
eukprot:scaffold14064_cov177-Amphora_coffeaeformis.AAC.4